MTTTKILLDASTIDTLLLEDGPEDRLRSAAMLSHMDDQLREIRRFEELDAEEDARIRRWQEERELAELDEAELGGEG